MATGLATELATGMAAGMATGLATGMAAGLATGAATGMPARVTDGTGCRGIGRGTLRLNHRGSVPLVGQRVGLAAGAEAPAGGPASPPSARSARPAMKVGSSFIERARSSRTPASRATAWASTSMSYRTSR